MDIDRKQPNRLKYITVAGGVLALVVSTIQILNYFEDQGQNRRESLLEKRELIEESFEHLGFRNSGRENMTLEFYRDRTRTFEIPTVNLDLAKKNIQKLEILFPEERELAATLWLVYSLMAGKYEEVEVTILEGRNIPGNPADKLVYLAGILHKRFNLPSQANLMFERALARTDSNFQHLIAYASFLHSSGHLDLDGIEHQLALEVLELAEKEAPSELQIHLMVGHILAETGRVDESVLVLKRMLIQSPAFAEGYNTLGGVQWQNNQFTRARSNFEFALALEPTNVVYLYNVSIGLRSLGLIEEANQRLFEVKHNWNRRETIESWNGEPIVSY